jgi:phosphatidylinositol-bisphosphatase
MGNKGAVSIRFNYHDTSFCFVAAHLSSGKGEVEARNRDYFEIIRKTTFRPAAAHAATADGTHTIEKPWRRVGITAAIDMYINDHAVVVWMGDLNYRLDGERDDIIELTMKDELETLGAKDQLNMERAKRPDLFQNFCEAEITFPPTYKYEPGTTQYDSREGKKLRSPAWCDRILFYARSDVDDTRIKNNRLSTSNAFAPFSSASSLRFVPSSDSVDPTMLNKGGSNGRIACLRYTADGIMCSDHRPVSALLVTQIHSIDEEKEKIAKEAVLMEISRSENARMPKVDMPNRTLLFDDCEVGVPTTRYLELHNVGQAPAKWSFMSVTPGRPPTPAWLTVSPQLDVCLRGEQQAIAVTVCIPEEDARSAVSLKEERIDDILVVRVQGGCDFFVPIDVPVQGTLSASVASSSVRTKRQLGHVSITRGESSSANALAVVSSAASSSSSSSSSSALTPASTVFSCLAADGSAAEEEREGLTTSEPVTSEEDDVTSMTHDALHVMSGIRTHRTGGGGAHDSSDSDLEAEEGEGGRVKTVA